MIKRNYWLKQIKQAWGKRSIIWLAGVRRVGKTCLCKTLNNVEYFDCELPRIRQMLEDPEYFLNNYQNKKIILDEIHRLTNPSELLKIAADHYPNIKIIATGSSTLGASKKFRDTLTGRKTKIHLTPMLYHESKDFNNQNIMHRLLNGGLPPFFLSKELPESDFQEWLSSYWAKDIQELFNLEKRHSFVKFTELLFSQSGNMFEATRFASPCEVSRITINNYLSALETTYVAYVIKPYSTHSATEIISAPKVYGFDTGFVCHAKGWLNLHQDDIGYLWEHIILNELKGLSQNIKINYWRDKQGHEIDFILPATRQNPLTTIECKWSASKFNPSNLKIFRKRYPNGNNYLIASDIDRPYQKNYDGIILSCISIKDINKIFMDTNSRRII